MDVYSEWVDACDSVAKEDTKETGDEYATSRRTTHDTSARDDDRDGIVDDEDGHGSDGYEGDGIVADDDY